MTRHPMSGKPRNALRPGQVPPHIRPTPYRDADAHHDHHDAARFVPVDEYKHMLGRWRHEQRRAERRLLWATIGWLITGLFALDTLMRWAGAPW